MTEDTMSAVRCDQAAMAASLATGAVATTAYGMETVSSSRFSRWAARIGVIAMVFAAGHHLGQRSVQDPIQPAEPLAETTAEQIPSTIVLSDLTDCVHIMQVPRVQDDGTVTVEMVAATRGTEGWTIIGAAGAPLSIKSVPTPVMDKDGSVRLETVTAVRNGEEDWRILDKDGVETDSPASGATEEMENPYAGPYREARYAGPQDVADGVAAQRMNADEESLLASLADADGAITDGDAAGHWHDDRSAVTGEAASSPQGIPRFMPRLHAASLSGHETAVIAHRAALRIDVEGFRTRLVKDAVAEGPSRSLFHN